MESTHQEPGEDQAFSDNPPESDINTDENISGTAHLNDDMEDESESERLEKEMQELRDKYLRLVAEFDNFKKRNARERIELIQTANKEVIISLLDILDDCDRAVGQLETSGDMGMFRDGVMLVFGKLKGILQARGLREMQSLHVAFNTDLHDAITEIKAPEAELKGKVLDNLQKGYYLNDKIIRHAKVVVGK
ncbi:MAG TPA: nucleotide exchange factor GrpE [Chitinophagaceae bacterium]|nr:nucleotide exchange factor GrpE [Chitinophagaceae bacterium]